MYICHAFGRAWGSQVVKLRGGEARVLKEVTMQALPATHKLMDHMEINDAAVNFNTQ